MDIKTIERAAKTVKRIKAIDAQAIKLEALAERLAAGEKAAPRISLAWEPAKVAEREATDDPMHYIAREMHPFMFSVGWGRSEEKPTQDALDFDLSDVTALRVVACLYDALCIERKALLLSLSSPPSEGQRAATGEVV